MASLNGNQINQTYQGLVKFIDNGNVSASAKELTDGQGNSIGILVSSTGNTTISGDLTVQGTIDATGANKIAFFYADQASFPSATTYHGAIAHSHADGKMYYAHSGAWVELANASDVTSITVDDVTIAIDGTEISVKDDSISFAKLTTDFKTSNAVTPSTGAATLDFTSSQVFTVAMTEDTTFSFSNDEIGMVKDLILTGEFVPTFPTGVNTITGTYDGTVSNFIQIVKTGASEYWLSISKAQ